MKKILLIMLTIMLSISLIGCNPKDITKEDVKDFTNDAVDKGAEVTDVIVDAGKEIIDIFISKEKEKIKDSDNKEKKEKDERKESKENPVKEEVKKDINKENANNDNKKKEDIKKTEEIKDNNKSIENKKEEVKIVEAKEETILEVKPEQNEVKVAKKEDKQINDADSFLEFLIGDWHNAEYDAVISINEYFNFVFGTIAGEIDATGFIRHQEYKNNKLILEVAVNDVYSGYTDLYDMTFTFEKIDNKTINV